MMSIRNILFALLATFIVAGPVLATDPPHDSSNSIECLNCHNLHSSLGGALTTLAGNANLCQSCHVTGGTATGKPFVQSDQAKPGLALPAGMTARIRAHRVALKPIAGIHRPARSYPAALTPEPASRPTAF